TRLPWDEKWIIESLSDSTLYMAYYTIAHLIQNVPVGALRPALFDHVFLGEGSPADLADDLSVPADLLERMRAEFTHWYPMDLRISGKDLIQNHLSFCIFNHTAILPREYWPRAFGLNGWILVGGTKMSKSAGNFYTLREAIERWGADVIRFTLANGGDGLDDPNFDPDFAGSAGDHLDAWLEFATAHHGRGVEGWRPVDRWFRSVLHATLSDYIRHMDLMEFRAALKRAFFDLQRDLRWYLRRCGEPNRDLMAEFVDIETQMLSPFVPHLCEEIWSRTGHEDFISTSRLPEPDTGAIDRTAMDAEALLVDLMGDLREILSFLKGKAGTIHLYTAAPWKWRLLDLVRRATDEGPARFQDVMRAVMGDPEIRRMGKAVPRVVQRLLAERSPYALTAGEERAKLETEAAFLESEFGLPVRVWVEGEAEDPMGKARNALPLKPAIYVEPGS
ncbi:MAG TPA: leucine--tRNA ligase, partial [Thermoplasmata archaeon]|nr:leucine--tRNA ligase [Thermoplasmata archaeon]